MSNSFDSGVARYIIGVATVTNGFPVDFKGNARICCEQCFYYRDASRRCCLNGQISEFPAKFVGSKCPLEIPYENMGEDAQEMENE